MIYTVYHTETRRNLATICEWDMVDGPGNYLRAFKKGVCRAEAEPDMLDSDCFLCVEREKWGA